MTKMRSYDLLGLLNFGLIACLTIAVSVQNVGAESGIEPNASAQIPIMGYIENQEFLTIATQIGTEYLSHQFTPPEDRKLGIAVTIYIGPNLISNGRFVPPDDYFIPPEQLEILGNKTFPDEGCRVERLLFTNPSDYGEYIVLLTDASDQPTHDYIEQCLLLATLTALGEKLDGTPVEPADVLRNRIKQIVGELR